MGINDQTLSHRKVAIVAETVLKAGQFVECLQQQLRLSLGDETTYTFSEFAENQDCPHLQFDELHWLCTSPKSASPWVNINELAPTIHIHQLTAATPTGPSDTCIYRWRNYDELVCFWGSFYAAQILQSVPGLDWSCYTSFTSKHGVGRSAAGWGETRTAAISTLLADAPPALYQHTTEVVLIIEAKNDFTLGEYVSIVSQLEEAIGSNLTTTGWVTTDYHGYGLKLLMLSPFCASTPLVGYVVTT